MRYTLMREKREVLEFDVDLASGDVSEVRPLDGVAYAPLGVLEYGGGPEAGLKEFIWGRVISPFRSDARPILEAVGARSTVELAFRSGGFSLFDPYWYRAPASSFTWEGGNFFDNEWDHTFGEAILQENYSAVKRASIAVPDVTCGGASRKAWVRDGRSPILLKDATAKDCASMVGESLVSRMLSRLLPETEFMRYELVERFGTTYSACRAMVNAGEELAMAWQAISAAGCPAAGSQVSASAKAQPSESSQPAAELLGRELLERFGDALVRLGVEGGELVAPKMTLIAHLALIRDAHACNMGVIRRLDCDTPRLQQQPEQSLRLAPFFDYDRAFGLSRHEQMEWVCAHPQAAMLLGARAFSSIEPAWDYSWYDPCALDGFEKEIEQALSASDRVPEGYAAFTARMFAAQRTYVNEQCRERKKDNEDGC